MTSLVTFDYKNVGFFLKLLQLARNTLRSINSTGTSQYLPSNTKNGRKKAEKGQQKYLKMS